MKFSNIKSCFLKTLTSGNNDVRLRSLEFSDNLLDKDFQAMLLPLNMLQTIYLNFKYKIHNDRITMNNFTANLVSFCGTCLSIAIYIYRIFSPQMTSRWVNFSVVLNISYYFDSIFYCISFLLNFIDNLSNSKLNVSLVLNIHNVRNICNFNRHEYSCLLYKSLIAWNWICVTLLAVIYLVIIVVLPFIFHLPYFCVEDFTYVTLIIRFDINVFYAIRMMRILRMEMQLWIRKIKSFQYEDNKMQRFRQNKEIDFEKMYQACMSLCDGHEIYKKVFEKSIAFHTTETFIHAMIYIQILIDLSQVSVVTNDLVSNIMTGVTVLSWLLKNILLQTLLGAECETFYVTANNMRSACLSMLNTENILDGEEKNIKNILRVINVSFNKMSACGLFTVNATLPLHLLGVLATYTIVLLQFAFLK